ncbi:hypothetical protein N665_2097s0007 [Sinapis alba]|nr:hypothetical protein N665_5992s0001 [Sinapis alba]KAF8049895.1 hypothetical protein N665_2097s0007 [Sinapis alba]
MDSCGACWGSVVLCICKLIHFIKQELYNSMRLGWPVEEISATARFDCSLNTVPSITVKPSVVAAKFG